MNEPFFLSLDAPRAEPFEPSRLDEDHSKAETPEAGFSDPPLRIKPPR
jgi:hypothetical protein